MTLFVSYCANGLQRANTLILPFMSSIMFQYFFRNTCDTQHAALPMYHGHRRRESQCSANFVRCLSIMRHAKSV